MHFILISLRVLSIKNDFCNQRCAIDLKLGFPNTWFPMQLIVTHSSYELVHGTAARPLTKICKTCHSISALIPASHLCFQ